jgi:hypothetical protein
MGIDEIEPGRSAPVSEQARLDVLRFQRLPEQRIVEQIYLSNRKIVGGAPIGVEMRQFLLAQCIACCALGCCFLHEMGLLEWLNAIDPRSAR